VCVCERTSSGKGYYIVVYSSDGTAMVRESGIERMLWERRRGPMTVVGK